MMSSPMMSDQFCLRWNNFQTNIVNALDSLKCSEDLVDVTLTCEGRNIKAHKVILSACSPYFRTVFKENPCQHPIIILKDVLAEDIINLLSYMYQGEVFIEESRLSSFLHTAALLQVKGLTEVPQQGRETTTEVSPTNKLYTQLTISPKTNTSQKDLNKVIKHYKKRRNSASDRLGEALINDGGKKSKASDVNEGNTMAEHLAAVVHEPISRLESDVSSRLTESGDDKSTHDKNDQGHGQNVKPGANQSRKITDDVHVTIKTEANDPTVNPTPPNDFTTDNDDSNSDHPEYETSMLARSLLAGTHSVKSDANANITPTKPKVVAKMDVPGLQRQRDSTAKVVAHKQPLPVAEDQIKAERLSPKPVSMDLEPEVVISEHDTLNTDMYIQDRSQAGISLAGFGPGASSLQVHAQANHAAICGDCPHCGTKYSNQSALKYHVRLMHSDLTNRLCCYLCPRSFTMRDTFKEHMWSTHGQRN